MASKFWGKGSDSEEESTEEETSTEEEETSSSSDDSSSESGSSSGSDSDSSSDSDDSSRPRGGANRFLLGSSDSESEDERRVVRSAKSKALIDLQVISRELREQAEQDDWAAVLASLDRLSKQAERARKVGGVAETAPLRAQAAALSALEAQVARATEEKPKLSPTNTRALTRVKNNLRRLVDPHRAAVDAYAEDGRSSESEPEEPEEPRTGAAEARRRRRRAAAAAAAGSGSEAGSGAEGSDASSSRRFSRARTGVAPRPKDALLTAPAASVTHAAIASKLAELSRARGKAGRTERADALEVLDRLADPAVARVPAQRVAVLAALVTLSFDQNVPSVTPMAPATWARCARATFDILAILENHPNVQTSDVPPEEDQDGAPGAAAAAPAGSAAAGAAAPQEPQEPDPDAPATVWCNLPGFLDRLDDEWIGGLRSLDPHAHEYVARLRDEPVLLALGAKVAERLERVGATAEVRAAVAVLRAHHFYAKTDIVYDALRKLTEAQQKEAAERDAAAADADAARGEAVATDAAAGADAAADAAAAPARPATPPPAGEATGAAPASLAVRLPADFRLPESSEELMASLCREAYSNGTDAQRAAASLLDVYWRASRGDFFGARDALLRTRVQDQAGALDPQLGVLLNRAHAALGLAALRNGRVADAHSCLAELYGSGRAKELLAQGLSAHRYGERTPEAEAAERRRQVPFHLHVNLELLEAAVLTAGVLLEVPAAAAAARPGGGGRDARRRVASKPLRRLLDNYERQTFVGPPENVRDHAAAAARALAKGDWRAAHELVAGLPCWTLLPGSADVLESLRGEFKRAGLRTFLVSYARFYASLSLDRLAEDFELPANEVHAVASRLMADDLLPASHDAPTRSIAVHAAEPTKLLARAAAFADKAAILVDLNERALQARTGVLSADDEDGEGGRGGRDGGPGGRRTRGLGGVHGLGGGDGRGRGRGRGGRGNRGNDGRMGFNAESGYSGGVYGRGRANRPQGRDDSNFIRLGRSRHSN